MEKFFDYKKNEDKWYKFWLDNNFFKAETGSSKKPYSLIMPPPNLTGALHLGHIWQHTISDCVARFKRMQSFDVLWLPGVDHAGIQMQTTVERRLKKEKNLNRHQLGRQKFIEYIWQCKEEWYNQQKKQMRKIGESADWSREKFTLDPGPQEAVKEEFWQFFKVGKIYFGSYQVNWCPSCETALMDIETEHLDRLNKLYYLKYLAADKTGDFLTPATVRPETILADSAVAVNPADKRYAKWLGRSVLIPVINKPIPVIADKRVEPDFASGVLKITPAHSVVDYAIGNDHKLAGPMIITRQARLDPSSELVPDFVKNEKVIPARLKLVNKLQELNLIDKVEDYNHSVQVCERCKTDIEPLISEEWFVKMNDLARKAVIAIKAGEVVFQPSNYKKISLNWLNNIKDWCVSRSLWWGHNIPIYYCQKCKDKWPKIYKSLQTDKTWAQENIPGAICSKQVLSQCPFCQGKVEMEEKVLDTWFSSGLWPLSTLGWPEKTKDLKKYYPTDLMTSASEIIFLWILRMIMLGLYFKKKVPFVKVFLHGTLRDQLGVKMSKSLGNGVDPNEMIDKYSADAVRFALAQMTYPGRDIKISKQALEDRIRASRNFSTKLWNISRFILKQTDSQSLKVELIKSNLKLEDKWILTRLSQTVLEVTTDLERLRIGQASEKIYNFIWKELADWYLEIIKFDLLGKDKTRQAVVKTILLKILKQTLRLTHPFLPFISEEINFLIGNKKPLAISCWPKAKLKYSYKSATRAMDKLKNLITARRADQTVKERDLSKEERIIFNNLTRRLLKLKSSS